MTRNLLCAIGVLAAVLAAPPAGAEGAASKIASITLYRGQALVTRTVPLPNKTGELEIVVADLPAQIVGASLHASAGDGIKIRSVRYRSRAVAAEPKKELADLDAQIKDLTRQIAANRELQKLLEGKAGFVQKLEGFTAAAAKADAGKASLDPKSLATITTQIFAQYEALVKERISLREAAEDLNEKLNLLKRRRGELARGQSRTVREAVLFVARDAGGAGEIHLSYLVGSANWTPAYNFRLGDDGRKISVEYLAHVQQMSGEDWSGVKLTLSTATPAMNAESPLLVPYWIQLGAAPGKAKAGLGIVAGQYALNVGQQMSALSAWNVSGKQAEQERANWELNRLAAGGQSLELNVKADAFRAGVRARRSVEEGLAVSYRLEGLMGLPSRSDRQLLQIAKIELPIESYHVAIPLLSTYVYRGAKASNSSSLPLLAGPYNAYVGGEFVGRGWLGLVARGQEFTVGLGVDTQLRCSRELMEKSDRVVWGSRVQEFHYRLRVENYKDKPVAVRLLDRIPATKTEDVKVTLGGLAEGLSTDPVYVRDLKDRGMLRWDLAVGVGAAGAKARDVLYSFEMKYAKDKHVGRQAVSATASMKAEFEKLLLKKR